MKWMVVMLVEAKGRGKPYERVEEVFATNKSDAAYRGALRAEVDGSAVIRVVRVLKMGAR